MAGKRPLIYITYAQEGYCILLDIKDVGIAYVPISTLDWTKLTTKDCEEISQAIDSDGCTGVPDFYLNSCIKHDFWYATHKDFNGEPITRAEADSRFRRDIQAKSLYGWFSPMSWWRWAAVRILGSRTWNREEWR